MACSLALTDGQLELANASLQTEQVSLQLSLLLLSDADLVLQFLILGLLLLQVSLEVFLNAHRLVFKFLARIHVLIAQLFFELGTLQVQHLALLLVVVDFLSHLLDKALEHLELGPKTAVLLARYLRVGLEAEGLRVVGLHFWFISYLL